MGDHRQSGGGWRLPTAPRKCSPCLIARQVVACVRGRAALVKEAPLELKSCGWVCARLRYCTALPKAPTHRTRPHHMVHVPPTTTQVKVEGEEDEQASVYTLCRRWVQNDPGQDNSAPVPQVGRAWQRDYCGVG